MAQSDPDRPPGGLASTARRVSAAVLDIAATRVELALTELAEERLRLSRQLWLNALSLLFTLLASVWVALWLVEWAGPERRLGVLGALALGFAAAALGCAWRSRSEAARRPPLMDATLAELRRDAAALRGEDVR